jgi:hypothetical protein
MYVFIKKRNNFLSNIKIICIIAFCSSSVQLFSQDTYGCYLAAYLGGGAYDASSITPSDFNDLTGKQHAAFSRYLNSGSSSDLLSPQLWEWSNLLKTNGARPILFLMPFDELSQYYNGNRDQDLITFGEKCAQFQEKILIIFGHEMNTPWGPYGQKPTEFVQAFRHVALIMDSVAANIDMCWVPGQAWGYPWGGNGPGEGYDEYYPGDDVVDWVGTIIHDRDYNENNESEPDLFAAALKHLDFYNKYAQQKQKPMIIAETSLFDANWDPTDPGVRIPLSSEQLCEEKNQWIDQVYDVINLLRYFPYIDMICYFHVAKMEEFSSETHNFGNILTDWRIPLESGYDLYKQKIKNIYFLSQFPTTKIKKEPELSTITNGFILYQNYPNPFNSFTRIRYHLKERNTVRIEVFDLAGRYIITLFDGIQQAGTHSLIWESDLAAGVYLYRLKATFRGQHYVNTKKMLLLR